MRYGAKIKILAKQQGGDTTSYKGTREQTDSKKPVPIHSIAIIDLSIKLEV